jgi:hypothetical protein
MKNDIPVPPALPPPAVAHELRTAISRIGSVGFISVLRRVGWGDANAGCDRTTGAGAHDDDGGTEIFSPCLRRLHA